MAEKELQSTLQQLHSITTQNLSNASTLLSRAKISLLHLNALVPTSQTPPQHLALGRDVLEIGALVSIRQKDPEAFTRYYQQLQPFYSLPTERWGGGDKGGNQSKVTGLYLLLLLSQGDYAGFHTLIESLEVAYGGKKRLDEDAFIQYPMRLEQALMEGSYDRVWGETKGERVPGEEFGVFSEVRTKPYTASMTMGRFIRVGEANADTGPHQHNSLRDSLLQRACLPFPPHFQRQEPPLPRLRGRRRRVCTLEGLGGARRPHLLS